MSPSNSTKSHEPESTQKRQSPESTTPIHEPSDPPPTHAKTSGIEENPAQNENDSEKSMKDGDGDEEEEEVGECGFCLFMKEGGCKDAFVEWEKCIEEAEKNKEDVVQKCFQATQALKTCMEAHSDYYAPILQAEESLKEEAVKQLEEEKEKEKLNSEGGGGSQESDKKESLGGNDSNK